MTRCAAPDMVSQIQGNLDAWAASQAENAASQQALRNIYGIQADLIINKNGEPLHCSIEKVLNRELIRSTRCGVIL